MSNGAAMALRFTPVQQRIIDLLSDGKPHTRQELHNCLEDRRSKMSAIHHHLIELRAKLEPQGTTILCQLSSRRIFYRHVRLLTSGKIEPLQAQRPADWDER